MKTIIRRDIGRNDQRSPIVIKERSKAEELTSECDYDCSTCEYAGICPEGDK